MPTAGHILDASTAALWRFDGGSRDDTKLTITNYGSAGSAQNASGASESTTAVPRPVGPSRASVRAFSGSQSMTCSVGGSSIENILKADHTLECFIYLNNLSATQHIVSYGASGESTATNYLTQWSILTSGRQQIFNENGAGGTNNTVAQSTGTALTSGAWYYIAVTRDSTNFNFYVNGSLAQSVAKGTTPTGGTSCYWTIGDNESAGGPLNGYLAHLMLTSGAKDSSTISSQYSAYQSSFALSTGSAICHWKMTDLADTVADDNNAISLWPFTSSSALQRCGALVDDGGGSTFFNATYAFSYAATATIGDYTAVEALRQTLLAASGGWTFECWFKIAEATWQASTRGLFVFGDPASALAAQNCVGVEITSTSTIRFVSQYGTDSSSTHTTTYALPSRNARYHLGIVRNATSGGKHSLSVYVNGTLQETLSTIEPFANGASGSLYLGRGPSDVAFLGCIDDVRISTVARTAAEVLESYQRGMSTPTVSIVSPSSGATLPTTSWVIDVTGDHGGVYVTQASVGPELIHDGSNFVGQYTSCTRTLQSASVYRYTLARRTGWTGLPTFSAISGRRT